VANRYFRRLSLRANRYRRTALPLVFVGAMFVAGCMASASPAAAPTAAPAAAPAAAAATAPGTAQPGRATTAGARPATGAAALAPAAEHVFPGAAWQRHSSAAAAGWSAAALKQLRARLADLPTTGFMAVAGGRVFFEYGDLEAVSYLASVRKSVLSMLYGRYVEAGTIRLDRTLAELGIDDHQGLTPAEQQATIRHLLSARSGVYHPAANTGDDLAHAPPRGSQQPGTYYLYSNWDFNALGTIFEQETGRNIYDALESDLARPIGMQDFDRSLQQKTGNLERSRNPAYHIHLSTRDMARLGYLMLREGNWAGTQLVPRDWVRESTRVVTPRTEMNPERRRQEPFGYGYLWWIYDDPRLGAEFAGAYMGHGMLGQHILVLPALDLVVAHKTRPGQDRSVSHAEFQVLVEQLGAAHCGNSCGGH
jgi:CubicO group peptidase (beta-lactamase class C family)